MTCLRCDGLVVTEHIEDPHEGAQFAFDGWRCLNCGAIDDDVIRANRLASLAVTAWQSADSASGDGALPTHTTSQSAVLSLLPEEEPPWWVGDGKLRRGLR